MMTQCLFVEEVALVVVLYCEMKPTVSAYSHL
jgi:hypothetical protein